MASIIHDQVKGTTFFTYPAEEICIPLIADMHLNTLFRKFPATRINIDAVHCGTLAEELFPQLQRSTPHDADLQYHRPITTQVSTMTIVNIEIVFPFINIPAAVR